VSPTYEASARVLRELRKLPREQRRAFLASRDEFVAALQQSPPQFPPALRVKRVQGTDDVWELTFASNGRATFRYGPQVRPGEPHIVWLRIGTHAVLDQPAG
jgi:hypothetical protein